MEYRARSDEAWYGARVAVQQGLLRVMFENSTEDADEWYDPVADLASPGDVDALRARFRRESPALHDARCGALRPGDRLCLACDIYGDADELKYYDAVLETVSPPRRALHSAFVNTGICLSSNGHRPHMQVEKAAHGTVDGVERCACRFTARWTEGPRRGCSDKVGVEVVCFVQESPIQDPVLTEFLDGVRNRFGEDQGEATAASQQAAPSGEGEIAPVSSLTYSSSSLSSSF